MLRSEWSGIGYGLCCNDYSPEGAEEGAKRNRASWRRDCEEICRAGRCSDEMRGLAQKMLRLLAS